MKLPFKPSLLTIRRLKPRWIILHHTAEIYEKPEIKIDSDAYQMSSLFSNVIEDGTFEVNYHYIIDKIKDDYIPIVCRPFVYLCDWEDIHKDINNAAIHIALMGNYDFKIPSKRCYEVLAYKLLNPMLKMFSLTPQKIKLHNEVSDNKELACPGEFIDISRVITEVRKYTIK